MLTGHSRGEVLEMPDRVAQEPVVWPIDEKPDQGRVGRRRGRNKSRLVQLKDRGSRFSPEPEGL